MKTDLTKYEKELIEHLTDLTNRSVSQTIMLFGLCTKDFNILCRLEENLMNSLTFYCPSTTDEVIKCLSLKHFTNSYDLDKISQRNKEKQMKLRTELADLSKEYAELEKKYKNLSK